MKKELRLKASILIITVVILISFWNINNIFFQQDEWLGLGGVIYRQETYGTWGSIAQIFNFENKNESTRFLPVASILNQLVYSSFGLNTGAYGILALILITICAIILNSVVFKLTNSYLLSTLTSALWVTNNLAYQAFTWIGTMLPSIFSVLFFLLSFYFLLFFYEKKKNTYLIWSLILIVVSLFSKETSFFYPIVYLGIIWFFFFKKFYFLKKVILSILLFIPLAITLILPRLLFLVNNQSNFSPPINPASKGDLIYNFFLLPAKSLFHVFLPNAQIYELVYSVNRSFFGNQSDGFVIERIVGDAFSLLIAFYILVVILVILTFSTKENKKLIMFSMFSFFASTLPFIIFKHASVALEQRYYIYPAIFGSLLAVGVIYSLVSRFSMLRSILMVLIFTPILFTNIRGVKGMLDQDIKTGNFRREILKTVSEIEPSLGKDNIFYFFTAHTGFYEFQSGFGQTLAVYFYRSGKIPKEVLIDRDFWDPSYEGFKNYSERKFGYYMSYDKLLKIIQDNQDISLNSVHSFYWDYQKHTVKDVSGEIREKLLKDLKNAKPS